MTPIASAARANLVFGVTNLALSAVASIVVARLLQPVAYADYATMLAIVSWCLLITEAGGNTGFARYLKEAGAHGARGSLHRAFLRYRWRLAPIVMAFLLLAGPLWVRHAGLAASNWPVAVFAILSLIVVANLQGLLGYYGLISTFHHARALSIAQITAILKALALILAALLMPVPVVLASSILAVSLITAWWYHLETSHLIGEEQGPLAPGLVNAAHRHGWVAVLDKLTPAIGNAPFLLIVLAGQYARPELALLAVATEFLQKALTVANLPMANMVMPYLHRWQNTDQFVMATRRTGAMGLLVMLPLFGATLVFAPHGLPLLFGERYVEATTIVLWMTLPMFVEAWCRMVWGFSLLTNGCYKMVVSLNIAQGFLALIVLVVTFRHGILTIVIGQAAVQLTASAVLLFMAWREGLFNSKVFPQGLAPTALLASVIALLTQYVWLHPSIGHWAALPAISLYAVLLTAGMRYLVRLDQDTWHALSRVASERLQRLFIFIFRAPRKEGMA